MIVMAFFSENLALPDNAFLILRNLIMERTGIYFEDDKKDILADKLSDRVVERGFNSFLDYYYLLKYGKDSDDEWLTLVDIITVKETYFWREFDQFEALVNYILPEFVNLNNGNVFRIWCAACATGEEPLSIAMSLDASGWLKKLDFEILASDASMMALKKARSGKYTERSFKAIPESIRQKYFTQSAGEWQISPEIHRRIRWENINLVNNRERSQVNGFNVIFCRNVFIYMKDHHIQDIVQSFHSQLLSPGYLFVGVSESLYRIKNSFELTELGKTFVYKKR